MSYIERIGEEIASLLVKEGLDYNQSALTYELDQFSGSRSRACHASKGLAQYRSQQIFS